MSSVSSLKRGGSKPVTMKSKQQMKHDSLLVLGISLIVIFLGVFIFELSHLLTVTGAVNHVAPLQLMKSVGPSAVSN